MAARRVRGFGLTLVGLGLLVLAAAAALARGVVPEPAFAPVSFWGVLAVAGFLYVFLGAYYALLVAREGGDPLVGVMLLHTPGLALGAATSQAALFTIHLAGLRLGFSRTITDLTSEPRLYIGLTFITVFLSSLAFVAYRWTRGRGTLRKQKLALRKHVVALVLVALPWLGFMALGR